MDSGKQYLIRDIFHGTLSYTMANTYFATEARESHGCSYPRTFSANSLRIHRSFLDSCAIVVILNLLNCGLYAYSYAKRCRDSPLLSLLFSSRRTCSHSMASVRRRAQRAQCLHQVNIEAQPQCTIMVPRKLQDLVKIETKAKYKSIFITVWVCWLLI